LHALVDGPEQRSLGLQVSEDKVLKEERSAWWPSHPPGGVRGVLGCASVPTKKKATKKRRQVVGFGRILGQN
jgi:hypothetical protein